MGLGAYVVIGNASDEPVWVSYSNFNCMYGNGERGSNWDPITGNVDPASALPGKDSQYIEANTSGDCNVQSSTFDMTLATNSADATFNFTALRGYSVNNSDNALQTMSPGGANVWVSVFQTNGIFNIMVMIFN